MLEALIKIGKTASSLNDIFRHLCQDKVLFSKNAQKLLGERV
jgi:hypothetical protein